MRGAWMVPSKRPGPAGRTADPGLSGCGTRDRARRFTAVLLAEVQMLQDLEAVGDKQREEISGSLRDFAAVPAFRFQDYGSPSSPATHVSLPAQRPCRTRFPSHYTPEGWPPRRRLSCRALPPPPVALLVTARLTVAKSERHCWVNLAVGVLPRRSNGPFPKQSEEWHLKHT